MSYSALLSFHIFPSSHSLPILPANVFAQAEDGPVLRFSDEVGNPVFNYPGFSAEVVADGLSLPTTMAFLSQNDMLVLEKDKGTVMRVIDGQLQPHLCWMSASQLRSKGACAELPFRKTMRQVKRTFLYIPKLRVEMEVIQ